MNLKEKVLDDFEHNNMNKYEMNHCFVKSYVISLSNDQAMYGKSSLKIEYNFSGWLSGNGAMFIKFKDNLSTDVMPRKLGIWVYSDGKTPWLRASILDGFDGRKTVNLTAGNINWQGWKYLDAPLDKNWKLPLRLEHIYAVEIDKAYQGDSSYNGIFYIDHLRFVYIDDEDLSGPTFSNIYPKKDLVYKDSFTFHATATDDMSGVDPNSVIVKVNNNKVKHFFCEKLNKISYSFNNVEEGTYHIVVKAKDFAGNKSVPYIEKVITVDLSPDYGKPILSNITPTKTALVYTNTPRITFNLIDEKSGVNSKDILVTIDNEKQVVTYHEETGWGYAVSKKELTDGVHYFTIMAMNRSGNKVGPIKKKFTVNGLNQPKDKNNFKISVIPDTHSYEYGQAGLCSAVNEGTDFIIQMGDMVDQSMEDEYIRVQENLLLLGDKPILTVPGNHESFQGNLDSYMGLFGSPTYHVTYGSVLFIFLNTAYDQSICISDSTQMDYLEQLLAENKQENIVIITHVPTKDRFGTSHEMQKEDAMKLERILGNYKKENKSTQITVLFGHLHVIDQWHVEDVNYIITGNGASKGYVANNRGNIVGHGVLHMTSSGIKYDFIPYVEKVFLIKNDLRIKELSLIKGTSHRFNIQVEIKKLFSNYIVDITDFDLVRKKWSSKNESVVKVNKQGIVQAIDKGNTTVIVEVSGKRAEMKIIVKESNDADHIKIV
ncbi:metallophosphoesterase family protein [Sporosarcina sp. FSL K6-1508]|uniref:metallophosphoesterase family protein n=1 Tax=Sporosarcina sp. FSL K6-1508 TaxID=2921553 RepID=UPI0030FB721A